MKRWDPQDILMVMLVGCVFCAPMLAVSVVVIIAGIVAAISGT